MGGLEVTAGEYRAEGDDGPELEVVLTDGDPATAELYGPGGEDSPPLPDDPVLVVELDGNTQSIAAVASSDDTDRVAEAGEKRTYARGSGGDVVSSVHLKGDKTITIEQVDGSKVELETDGQITIDAGKGSIVVAADGGITLNSGAGTISVDKAGAISLSGVSVSLQTGESLGVHLTTLFAALTTWAPVLMDGGTALKTALLATYLTQTPPGP